MKEQKALQEKEKLTSDIVLIGLWQTQDDVAQVESKEERMGLFYTFPSTRMMCGHHLYFHPLQTDWSRKSFNHF